MQASSKRDILDLKKHLNKAVLVKFTGGREGNAVPCFAAGARGNVALCVGCAVAGTLKGFDPLVNLVLFDAIEHLQGEPQTCHDPPTRW